jgi:AhpD family alkylhydroperoxidase
MTSIQVYDPALCCSTGVCGVDVDQALVSFSADVDWAKQIGAKIERFNLAQQPQAFADNATVRVFLENSGHDGLPLILVDGQQVLAGRYPSRDELTDWIAGNAGGALFTPQVAELVAIGAAIASNCEPCFKYHYDVARKLGVSADDMRRAVDLAQKVKDAPARAMIELAGRTLNPTASNDADAKTASITSGTCCGPANKTAESAKSGCC